MAKRITGEELLQLLRDNPGVDEDELCIKAGYWNTRNGRQSRKKSEFFKAVMDAQGVTMVSSTLAQKGQGKAPSFRLKVGPKGLVPISAPYTKMMGWNPGSYVELMQDGGALVICAETSREDNLCTPCSVESPDTSEHQPHN